MQRGVILLLCAAFSTAVFGEIFYWIGDGNGQRKWGSFGDSANWHIGTDPANYSNPDKKIPGATDEIYSGNHGESPYYARWFFDLDGEERFLKSINNPNADWKRRYMSITNGTLEFVESLSNRSLEIKICNEATLKTGENSVSNLGDSGLRTAVEVYEGGRFELYGEVAFYNYDTKVYEGGSFVFDPTVFKFNENNNNRDKHRGQGIFNEGNTEFPNGVALGWYSEWADPATFHIRQGAGTMTVGGDIRRAWALNGDGVPYHYGELKFSLAGGIFKAVNDVSFIDLLSVETEDDTTAELCVTDGNTLDISPFTFGKNTSLVKTGSGRLVTASLPSSLHIESGILRPTVPGTLSGVTFAAGATLEFCVSGFELESLPNAADMNFRVDLNNLGAGTTLVRSSDNALLETIAAKLDASLPEGLKTLIRDRSIRLAMDVPNSFSSNGELDLSEPSGWKGSSVPEGADVCVAGYSTVALIGPHSPSFRSITVTDGAVLKVAPGTELPNIKMLYSGKILFEAGAESIFTNFTSSAAGNELPVIEVQTNAVVNLGKGFVFKNVDLHLYGKVSAANTVVFGGAAAGEVAYFAMTSDGGTIELLGKVGSAKRLVSPEEGGRVEVVGDILVKNTKILPDSNRSWGVSTDYAALQIGYRNPVDARFTVVVDGCFLDIGYEVNRICGGATVRCVNGGGLLRPIGYAHPGFRATTEISGDGRIVLEDGAYFRFSKSNARQDSVKVESLAFRPATEGAESLVIRNGSFFCAHQIFGNRRAVAVFEDSYYDIPTLPKTNSDFPAVTDTREWLTDAFNGLRSVKIEGDSRLYIRATNDLWGLQWDRDVRVADIPFTGGGSLVVTNAATGNDFRVTVVHGANTATGIATAYPDACGDDSMLLFNDRANWAGTVVANGHVALTNIHGSAAARVSFNALHLDGVFPIRAWAATNDMVDVATASLEGAGGIKPVAMDGHTFTPGDTLPFGTYPADAEYPARTGRDWVLFATEIPGNPDFVMLNLRYSPRGLVLSFR
jgi:hypothetical protein